MSEGVPAVGGAGRRAAMGVKMCIKRLQATATGAGAAGAKVAAAADDPATRPQALQEVDLMVTNLVLKAYLKPEAVGAANVRRWLGAQ